MSTASGLLIGALPTTVVVSGEEVPIRSDFRTGIRFDKIIWDKFIDERTRALSILQLYYGNDFMPRSAEEVTEAYCAILSFYQGGMPQNMKGRIEGTEHVGAQASPPKRLIDYCADEQLIYAAFLDQYRIDLNIVANLHWWKFRAMLAGLREDHMISHIIRYRAANPSLIKNKDERARVQRMQALYRIQEVATKGTMLSRAGNVFG